MKVTITEEIYIENEEISKMCHTSNNLYNRVNPFLRQQFINKEKLSSYNEPVKTLQNPSEHDGNNYQKLPAQTAQWIVKKVKQSWISFFNAMKEWKKQPERFNGMPKPPAYKNKNGEYMLIFTNYLCHIKEGILKFPEIMNMEVETRLRDIDLREVRIIPKGVRYVVEIVHRKDRVNFKAEDSKRIMGIDMGLSNIVSIADNISSDGVEGIEYPRGLSISEFKMISSKGGC
ncbi:MAG: hypothetical protein ACP5RS_04150 [Thermoplasmata archaeon]